MKNDTSKIVSVFAFIALVLTAFLYIFTTILPRIDVNIFHNDVLNVLRLIQAISLLIAIVFAAYSFAKNSGNKVWIIIFWIALIIYVAGAIFGIF